MSQVLAITGRVLPVTSEIIQLVAEFENGTRVAGESKICDFKKAAGLPDHQGSPCAGTAQRQSAGAGGHC